MIENFMRFFLGATLVMLPMVGVGVVFLLTGQDTGAGFQPAYLTMALTIFLALVLKIKQRARSGGLLAWLKGALPLRFRVLMLLTMGVVLLSALGIGIAPVNEEMTLVWSRFLKQVVQLGIMGFFALFLMLYLGSSQPNYDSRWREFSRWLVWGALLQVFYGVLQEVHFFHRLTFFPTLEWVFTSNPAILSGSEALYLGNAFQNVPRLRGTACEPLYLGNYLLLVWPFVALTGWSRIWRWTVVFLLLTMLVLTWSRGAWLGLLAQGVILVWLLLRAATGGGGGRLKLPPHRFWLGAGLGVGLATAIVLTTGWQVLSFPVERMVQAFSTQDWSNLTRLFSMQAAWRAFLLSPVVGVGWGQFAWHFPILVDPMGLQSQFTWPVVNNFPLQILCETGILGLGVFLLSGTQIIRGGLVAIKAGKLNSPAGVALVAVCGVWLQLLTFSQYNLPHIWVAVGTMSAVALRHSAQKGKQEAKL